ncbi:MAG: acyl-CoA desaturase [Acidobacteriales bacterium]|nr:acyl-CoA desaturase [Terriglobales bacterium]MCI0622368.1 acyl-CoA desaturase [Acidobacteriota bacterium]MCI0721287.1 acyl-CoA desaturase [Acidobacteriota bacterium]
MLIFLLVYYVLAGLGVNLGYHRLLCHRALRLPRWLERSLITFGLPAGTPIQWVGTHRFHHANADTPLDPHSPHYGGLLRAHCGWYLGTGRRWLAVAYALAGPLRLLVDAWLRPRTNQQFNHLASDVAADPYYRWLSRPIPYAATLHLHAVIPVTIALASWGPAAFALIWVTFALLYNIGDAIDSLSHWKGELLPGQIDHSRNHSVLGLVAGGEGWHANHHRHPWSARHGLAGQFDWTWQVIRFLGFLRLATQIKVANSQQSSSLTQG